MRALKEFKKLNCLSFLVNRREHKNSGDIMFSTINTNGNRYKIYSQYYIERSMRKINRQEGHAFNANTDKDWYSKKWN